MRWPLVYVRRRFTPLLHPLAHLTARSHGGEPLFSTHPLPPPSPTSQPSASVPAAEETPAQYVATPESVMITLP
jgi:hypothetical protein